MNLYYTGRWGKNVKACRKRWQIAYEADIYQLHNPWLNQYHHLPPGLCTTSVNMTASVFDRVNKGSEVDKNDHSLDDEDFESCCQGIWRMRLSCLRRKKINYSTLLNGLYSRPFQLLSRQVLDRNFIKMHSSVLVFHHQ